MGYAVALCLVGAGLALFASTRTWVVEVTVRPAPLAPARVPRTGGELLPWLPALALVGLAGTGAVPATRGLLRRLVGVVLALAGLGLGLAAGAGLRLGTVGAPAGWPALCLLGGLLLLTGGGTTVLSGHRWPAMGARYERRRAQRSGGAATASGQGRGATEVWDALDRGEDPTLG
jgi:hypothetical protein